MHRKFRRLPYRWRVSLVMMIFALIPFGLFGAVYLSGEKDKWEKDAISEYTQALEVETVQFDRFVQEMELKVAYVSSNSSVQSALNNISSMTLTQGLQYINELKEIASTITAGNDALVVRWYPYLSDRDYGGYSYTMGSLTDEFAPGDALYERIQRLHAGEILIVAREVERAQDGYAKATMEERICVYLKIGNMKNSDCLLEISMPIDQMLDIKDVKFPAGSIYGIFLQAGETKQTILMSQDLPDAQELLETYHTTGECSGFYPGEITVDGLPGSRVTCLFPENYVNGVIRGNMVQFLMIIVLFVLAILATSYGVATLLTARVTRSIEKMNNELDTFLTEPSASVVGDSDFLGIESRISQLIQNTREYSAKLEQHKAEMNRLELELLQMRFNPHFLYNTLASIRYQIKDQAIRKSIDSLIHYYRIVLSRGHLLIRIEEEIAMIREYLDLEIFAYRLENVKYEFDISEEIKGCTIIKHLLQPIVENAMDHGVRGNEKGGMIWISARPVRGDIVFEIRDNGSGMTPEQVENVLKEPAVGSIGGGYGVYNVQQRIETYYGDAYGITFHSKEGEGTRVMIRIPQRRELG